VFERWVCGALICVFRSFFIKFIVVGGCGLVFVISFKGAVCSV
jgi:hypothetical protein